MIFSEESSRAIYEMVNMELIELRYISATLWCREWVNAASDSDPIKVRWTESEQRLHG